MDKNSTLKKMISDSNLRVALDKLIENNTSNAVNIAPNIPEKKIANATRKMHIPSDSNILALFDTSISMSGKSGICVTNDGIYWKEEKIGNVIFCDEKALNIEIDLGKTITINGKKLSLARLLRNKKNWHFADFLSSLLGLEQTPAGPVYKEKNAKFDLLTKVLHNRKTDGGTCIKIVEALGQSGDKKSTEELCECLKDPETQLPGPLSNKKVCIKIIETIGIIGGDKATETLIELLDDSKTDGELCISIARVLGQIGDKRSKKALIRATADSVRGKRDPIGLLELPLSLVASHILERIMEENNGELYEEVKEEAKKGFVERIYAEDLKDKNLGVRRRAAKELGKIKDERAVEPLIQSLKDKDFGVRKKAADALGKIKDERAVEPLIQALNDKDFGVRKKVADALGKIGGERAVEPLIQALNDESELVRQIVAKSLGEIGDRRSIEPLFQIAHKDKSSLVRQASLLAIAEIGDIAYIENLRQFLNDKKWIVRDAAKQALKKFESKKNGITILKTEE